MKDILNEINKMYDQNGYLYNLRVGKYNSEECIELIKNLEELKNCIDDYEKNNIIKHLWAIPYIHAIYKNRIPFARENQESEYDTNRAKLFFLVEELIYKCLV